MAENLIPVEGVAYTANVFDDLLVAACLKDGAALQGVIRGATGGPFGYALLAVTGAVSPVAVATGAAWVNGKLYRNTASKNLNVSTPAGATRIDRVVLHLDYTVNPMTCVAQILAGVEGGAAPALTQVDGTTWEISLAQVSITTGGVITITDERVYAGDGHVHPSSLAASVAGNGLAGGAGAALSVNVDDSTIEINADALRVKDGGITPAKILNRARAFLVTVDKAEDHLAAALVYSIVLAGVSLTGDSDHTYAVGNFVVPQNFASAMTAKPVFRSSVNTGNAYIKTSAAYGGTGENWAQHADAGSFATLNFPSSGKLLFGAAVSLASAALGDVVQLTTERDDSSGSDTLGALCPIVGWLVEFTADS